LLRVLLIRHASNDFAAADRLASWTPEVHLNARGHREAQELAERLSGVRLNAIYSSPLERARETAQYTADRHGLPIEIEDAFGEVRLGRWSGKLIEELRGGREWTRWNALRSMSQAPGGEWMVQVQARMVAALERLRAERDGQTAAVFTHSDAIRAAAALYLGMPLDFVLRLDCEPASVSVFELAEWGPKLVAWNRTSAW
jgi:broad specificity phosphatase PhoE